MNDVVELNQGNLSTNILNIESPIFAIQKNFTNKNLLCLLFKKFVTKVPG